MTKIFSNFLIDIWLGITNLRLAHCCNLTLSRFAIGINKSFLITQIQLSTWLILQIDHL